MPGFVADIGLNDIVLNNSAFDQELVDCNVDIHASDMQERF